MMLMSTRVVGSEENENDVIVVCLSARCTPFYSPVINPLPPFLLPPPPIQATTTTTGNQCNRSSIDLLSNFCNNNSTTTTHSSYSSCIYYNAVITKLGSLSFERFVLFFRYCSNFWRCTFHSCYA
jgi:hypothetical protein